MDIHERQSSAPAGRWRAFQFSTLVMCVLGILGNMSSLVVLKRHLDEIAGSRLLLALAVADLNVVTSVVSRTLGYVTYGNHELTQVIDWWFIYSYYCSIYLTVLLSLDRYVHTAKPMLLIRINYHRILKRTILAVFGSLLVISLPHLLGNFVEYHHGSHTARGDYCPAAGFCNSTSIPHGRLLKFCDRDRKTLLLSPQEKHAYEQLKHEMCVQVSEHNYTLDEEYECHIPPVHASAGKFKPSVTIVSVPIRTRHDNYGLQCRSQQDEIRSRFRESCLPGVGSSAKIRHPMLCLGHRQHCLGGRCTQSTTTAQRHQPYGQEVPAQSSGAEERLGYRVCVSPVPHRRGWSICVKRVSCIFRTQQRHRWDDCQCVPGGQHGYDRA